LHVQVRVAIFVTMVTMQSFDFYLMHVGGRTNKYNYLNYK